MKHFSVYFKKHLIVCLISVRCTEKKNSIYTITLYIVSGDYLRPTSHNPYDFRSYGYTSLTSYSRAGEI